MMYSIYLQLVYMANLFYARCIKKITICTFLACENIRFSSLFVTGDVSRGGASATQRQKFHAHDAINVYIINPVVMGSK